MKTMISKKLTILIFLVGIFFFGCAGSKALYTPSGKPEVTIQDKTKKEVTDALVGEMLSRGFTIKSVTDYTVVFTKPLDSFAAALLFGSNYDVTPEHRPSFMLVESSAGVRIVLTNQIVTNPGSAFERVTDASTGEAGQSWQDFLTGFTNLFRGRVGLHIDNKGVIANVTEGSPAMAAGILKGDKLVSVDGVPYSKISQIVGDPDTQVTLVVLRQGSELSFTLTRKLLK